MRDEPESPAPRPLTLEELDRWVSFGAAFRVSDISERRATVDMCQCTGELVEQRRVSDPDVLAYLRAHPSSEDEPDPCGRS